MNESFLKCGCEVNKNKRLEQHQNRSNINEFILRSKKAVKHFKRRI